MAAISPTTEMRKKSPLKQSDSCISATAALRYLACVLPPKNRKLYGGSQVEEFDDKSNDNAIEKNEFVSRYQDFDGVVIGKQS